jgi:uncharacterized protein YkwD
MAILLALGLGACASFSQDPRPAPPPEPGQSDSQSGKVIAALIELHNRERAKEGLPPLKPNPQLEQAARRHARDMAARDKMSHTGGDGSSPTDRIKAAGYHFRTLGENVAEGQRTPEEAVKVWMNSPPHRKNILGEFSEIGAAVAESEDGKPYWCVDFGLPMPKLDPDEAASALLAAHNREREKADLKPLAINKKLQGAAQEQADAMARANSMTPRGGPKPFEQLQKAGYRFRKASENAASGAPTADDVIKDWMKGGPQKKNVLGDFRDVGIGYATAEDGTPYWVVLYGLPAGR